MSGEVQDASIGLANSKRLTDFLEAESSRNVRDPPRIYTQWEIGDISDCINNANYLCNEIQLVVH